MIVVFRSTSLLILASLFINTRLTTQLRLDFVEEFFDISKWNEDEKNELFNTALAVQKLEGKINWLLDDDDESFYRDDDDENQEEEKDNNSYLGLRRLKGKGKSKNKNKNKRRKHAQKRKKGKDMMSRHSDPYYNPYHKIEMGGRHHSGKSKSKGKGKYKYKGKAKGKSKGKYKYKHKSKSKSKSKSKGKGKYKCKKKKSKGNKIIGKGNGKYDDYYYMDDHYYQYGRKKGKEKGDDYYYHYDYGKKKGKGKEKYIDDPYYRDNYYEDELENMFADDYLVDFAYDRHYMNDPHDMHDDYYMHDGHDDYYDNHYTHEDDYYDDYYYYYDWCYDDDYYSDDYYHSGDLPTFCPNPSSDVVPCAPPNLPQICDKYNHGDFKSCYDACKPSFCCIHDSMTEVLAPSCADEENCSQYFGCYIIWWKLHDTVGPANYLRVEQDEKFYNVDMDIVADDLEQDPEFFDQLFGHHFDDDNALDDPDVFENPDNWVRTRNTTDTRQL